jgi:hypothetical protein
VAIANSCRCGTDAATHHHEDAEIIPQSKIKVVKRMFTIINSMPKRPIRPE